MRSSIVSIAGLALLAFIGTATAQPPAPTPSGAGAETAMLVSGKKTVYQRIMTRPGARLTSAPRAEDGAREVDPFSIYYVFARQGGFVKVGVAPRGTSVGWIAENKTIDWRQPIVVAFRDRLTSRLERTLLFSTREALASLLGRSDLSTLLPRLRQDAARGGSVGNGVVAIEPENYRDIRNPGSFYLFPILRAEANRSAVTGDAKWLEVAYVPEKPKAPPPRPDPSQFRASIVVVLDTTLSMGPYIEATRDALKELAGRLQSSSVGQNVRFGLVGFRQPTAHNPGIEYGTKTFLPVGEEATLDRFIAAISTMKEARVSTDGFDEDSIGGLSEALQGQNGSTRFAFRSVILVTDAGPRLPDGRANLAAGATLPPEIAALAREKGVHVSVIHLKTPEGQQDHAFAERQYRIMARNDEREDYSAIPRGNRADFAQTIGRIAQGIVESTQNAIQGRVQEAPPVDDVSAEANRRRAMRAMQLAYLARNEGEAIPDVVKAWMVDRDLDGSERPAVHTLLLLTKNQLSTLSQVMARLLESGDQPLDDRDRSSFVNNLRTAIGMLSTDPNGLARGDFRSVQDALGEYLADLPYTSPLGGLTLEEWTQMPSRQFHALKERLTSKRTLYERLHNEPNIWIRLHPEAPDGEMVTTLRLEDLP